MLTIHSNIIDIISVKNLYQMRKKTINIGEFINNCFKYSKVLILLFELIERTNNNAAKENK